MHGARGRVARMSTNPETVYRDGPVNAGVGSTGPEFLSTSLIVGFVVVVVLLVTQYAFRERPERVRQQEKERRRQGDDGWGW